MLDKKEFFKSVEKLDTGLQLHTGEEDLKEYASLLFNDVGIIGLSNEEFDVAVDTFRFKTSGSNFNKLPHIGDFVELLGLKPKSLEDTAKAQSELVFSRIQDMKYRDMVLFADPVTNYTIEKTFGGLGKFTFDYGGDMYNLEPKDPVWGKKEFISAYLTHADMGHEKLNPVYRVGAQADSKILFIGDANKCNQNIERHNQNCLRLESKPQNATIEKLTTAFKKD